VVQTRALLGDKMMVLLLDYGPVRDPQREKVLRSLHPDARRRHRRRRRCRWLRVALAASGTALLYRLSHGVYISNDNDPLAGAVFMAGLLVVVGLGVSAVLLVTALAAEVLDLLRRER